MKRIISALLTVAMLVTLITVPTLALGTSFALPAGATTTQELFDSHHNLFATKVTLAEGATSPNWESVPITFAFNEEVNLRLDSGMTGKIDIEWKIAWDANYLYILETRVDANITAVPENKLTSFQGWDGYDSTLFNILLPTDAGKTAAGAKSVMFLSAPSGISSSSAVGTTAAGAARIRNSVFQSEANLGKANASKSYAAQPFTGAYANYKTTATRTADGFTVEAQIPWTALATDVQTFDANNTTKIGIKFYIKGKGNSDECTGGKYILNNDNVEIGNANGDTAGFSTLYLSDAGVTKAPVITPDTEFETQVEGDKTYYLINTAAELLGLAQKTWDDANYTKGKAFKLTADVDLNPGWTLENGAVASNVWYGIRHMYGEFDGQGHTVKGLYNPGWMPEKNSNEYGFIGRFANGAVLKDLRLENGYFKSCVGDGVGSVIGCTHAGGDTTNKKSYVENVYSNVTVVAGAGGNNSVVGGFLGSAWSGFAVFKNCEYAGTVSVGTSLYAAKPTVGTFAGRSAADDYNKDNPDTLLTDTTVTFVECRYTGPASSLNFFGTGSAAYTNVIERAAIQTTEVADEMFSARILGFLTADELALDSVGMKVTVAVTYGDGVTEAYTGSKSFTTTTVYDSINAAGKKVNVADFYYDYAYGVVISDLPAAAGDTVVITVQLTQNGADFRTPYTATFTQPVAAE